MATEPYVRFTVSEVPGIRDAQGRYTSAITKQRDFNRDLGLVMQGRVVSLMRNRIAFGARASASTGRLVRVTANPRNLVVGNLSFGLGISKYLDGSVAKYWRTFEEGSAATWSRPFIGTQLLPVGSGGGGFKRGGGAPNAHGSMPGIRTSRKELPFLMGRYIVQREIEPARIYQQAQSDGLIAREGVAAAVRLLNRVLAVEERVR